MINDQLLSQVVVIDIQDKLVDVMPKSEIKKVIDASSVLIQAAKILVLGVTFKENCPDIRNSKVVDLVRELMDYSIQVHVVDPHGSPNELAHEYGISLVDRPLGDYDIILLAVGHKEYIQMSVADFEKLSKDVARSAARDDDAVGHLGLAQRPGRFRLSGAFPAFVDGQIDKPPQLAAVFHTVPATAQRRAQDVGDGLAKVLDAGYG